MRASLNGTVIAEADKADLLHIEGNWYFPPSSVNYEYLTESATPYTCSWKGECQYYTVVIDGQEHADNAWAYPEPIAGATERVGKDMSNYVAFWKDVEVTE